MVPDLNEEFEEIWESLTPAERELMKSPQRLVSEELNEKVFDRNQIVGSSRRPQPDGSVFWRIPAELAMFVAGK